MMDLDTLIMDLAGSERAAYLKHRWLAQTVDRLVQIRKRAGLTQAQVAERMGTTQSAIARMERDISGGISLRRIADYLIACGEMPTDVTTIPLDDAWSTRGGRSGNTEAAAQARERRRFIQDIKALNVAERLAQCPICMAERTNGDWHTEDCPLVV